MSLYFTVKSNIKYLPIQWVFVVIFYLIQLDTNIWLFTDIYECHLTFAVVMISYERLGSLFILNFRFPITEQSSARLGFPCFYVLAYTGKYIYYNCSPPNKTAMYKYIDVKIDEHLNFYIDIHSILCRGRKLPTQNEHDPPPPHQELSTPTVNIRPRDVRTVFIRSRSVRQWRCLLHATKYKKTKTLQTGWRQWKRHTQKYVENTRWI